MIDLQQQYKSYLNKKILRMKLKNCILPENCLFHSETERHDATQYTVSSFCLRVFFPVERVQSQHEFFNSKSCYKLLISWTCASHIRKCNRSILISAIFKNNWNLSFVTIFFDTFWFKIAGLFFTVIFNAKVTKKFAGMSFTTHGVYHFMNALVDTDLLCSPKNEIDSVTE